MRSDGNGMAMEKAKQETDEENEYYALSKRTFGILAPFYDLSAIVLSLGMILWVRDRAVAFANAKPGSRILDIATGTGRQAFAFAKKGYDVTGIDMSEAMLSIAKKKNRFHNLNFEIGDATQLRFENSSFDVCCVSFALHDMPPSIRKKVLGEMARVLKPGGIMVIVDYALPKNRISRFFIYNFVRLWEKYYSEFIKSDLDALLRASEVRIKEELPIILGAGRIVKGIKTGVPDEKNIF